MDTYLLLSAVFFVMLILFHGLQSVGKKMNKIANTYGVPKEKPQPYVKSEPKVDTVKEEIKKPEDDNSFAQRCKRQIEYEKTLTPGSEELKKVREDFEKAYLEERESVRVKMCEGIEIEKRLKNILQNIIKEENNIKKIIIYTFLWLKISTTIKDIDFNFFCILSP